MTEAIEAPVTKKLAISPHLKLPLDAVTQTFAILAMRGVGKTYTASVLAEEFSEAGLPFAVLDPTGADSPALQGALAWCEYMAPSISRRDGVPPSVRRTAREYGVPETTLRRALEARAKNGVSKAVRAALGRRNSFVRAP